MNQVQEALEASWRIVYSTCVTCDKRTCPLGEHSEQPQCNRFPNEDQECHIKQSIIKSNEALTALRTGELVVADGEKIQKLHVFCPDCEQITPTELNENYTVCYWCGNEETVPVQAYLQGGQ